MIADIHAFFSSYLYIITATMGWMVIEHIEYNKELLRAMAPERVDERLDQ